MPHCYPTVENLDLSRYSGVWWEIIRSSCIPYEKGCFGARADYCYDSERKCVRLTNVCYDCNGCVIRKMCGVLTPTCDGGKFKVKFDEVDRCGDYWVHWTDYDNFAIVGSSDRSMMWVLSRSKKISRKDGEMLYKLVQQYGYNPAKLIFSERNIIGARSRVKFIHNIFEGPNVDIYVNGDKIVGDVNYTRATEYMDLPSGNVFIQVKKRDETQAIVYDDIKLEMDANYTIIISGTVQAPDGCPIVHMMTLEDDNSCPLPCTSRLRFVHSNADIKALDVWINDEPKFMAAEYPLMKRGHSGYCDDFKYVAIKSGKILFQLKMKGTSVDIFETELELEEQKVYTIMPTGRWNADPNDQSFAIISVKGLDYCVFVC